VFWEAEEGTLSFNEFEEEMLTVCCRGTGVMGISEVVSCEEGEEDSGRAITTLPSSPSLVP